MRKNILSLVGLLVSLLICLQIHPSICYAEQTNDYFNAPYGQLLPASTSHVGLWWASSGWKISQDKPLPKSQASAIIIRTARNEAEPAQLVIRPTVPIKDFTAQASVLTAQNKAIIPAKNIDILIVGYVNITQPTDKSSVAGYWPDPLLPFTQPIHLTADKNQPLWIRVKVPRQTPAGLYTGHIHLAGKLLSSKDSEKKSFTQSWQSLVPLQVEVYDFALPDRMTCTTAFGFSPHNVFRYQKLTDERHKREVLEKYWANFSAHHISPYYPAPLDPFKVTWPKVTNSTKPEELIPTFDWTAWDKTMTRAIEHYHFNSFRLTIPGLGGGSYHRRYLPQLLGFKEDSPHYKAAFTAYCQKLQQHLYQMGWLDEAFIYWFDEPEPKDYEFVMNGFAKLKQACPRINRMLTEQPEPELIGGPNIWCPVSYNYDHQTAQEIRQKYGDKFWWYICCGPKAPYCTLFIDHPGTELRVWLWQTWKRKIEGILIWQTNYWTSSAAYPDPNHPQNPYQDPMSWVSGYDTPKGTKRPWGNGDGRFIYPPPAAANANPPKPILDGPVDSIRWEMLRDGIEDYEYLAILDRMLKDKKDKLTPSKQQEYIALLEVPESITKTMTEFTKDPAPIEAHRHKLAKAIAYLNKL